MKLSFDTVGGQISKGERSGFNCNKQEMEAKQVEAALKTCLKVRDLIGDVAEYVEVLKIRFNYTVSGEWVQAKRSYDTTPDHTWFTITGIIDVDGSKYDIYGEHDSLPRLEAADPAKSAEILAARIKSKVQIILGSRRESVTRFHKAVNTVKA